MEGVITCGRQGSKNRVSGEEEREKRGECDSKRRKSPDIILLSGHTPGFPKFMIPRHRLEFWGQREYSVQPGEVIPRADGLASLILVR